jgi:uncharacterized heparinase superfamily protein
MPSFRTYWHTLRYLRPVQIYGRVRFRFSSPRIDTGLAPTLRAQSGHNWVVPAPRNASLIAPERFRFLNEVHELSDIGWDDAKVPKLWRYNLHYFDDLNARDGSDRAGWHHTLLLQWIRDNPPAVGTGWEPYPTSLRIVNWIKWALNGNTLSLECIQSLAVQARWLSHRLEIHLLGNHLFSNGKALVFAGLFFQGPEADAWLETGLRILAREVSEQILPDGGHFERSTMYHALALEDMEDLCNVTAVFAGAIPSRWQSTVTHWPLVVYRMRGWLVAMSHPDGEIGYFNDAAGGVAPTAGELEQYALRLGLPPVSTSSHELTRLAASGYIRIDRGAAVAILDVAPVGPDYLPAHAHADTLSFEMSLFGQRVFVNSGTSLYDAGAERLRQRGTAAHNTVLVNGQNSTEIWDSFRVARRARPVGLEITCHAALTVSCAHDGYRRLRDKVRHSREWRFSDEALVVEDRVSPRFERAEARFHLHPSVRVVDSGDAGVTLVLPHGQKVRVSVEGGVLRTESATWHPEFGRTELNVCLAVDFRGAVVRTLVQWGAVV